MRLSKKGQGATEYLLMLAAVLVIVAIAVYYVTAGGAAKPNIQLTAVVDGTSIKLVATGGTDTCPANDWKYAVYLENASPTWDDGTATLSSTTDMVLKSNLAAGTTYKVRVQHIPTGQYFVDTTKTIA
ncbi:MAG: class III signal peptide-containing protein [Hadesarchaea archaeon]|nr:MAG: class III signal peptide-containing protein [Hadesarchaea archaeon]